MAIRYVDIVPEDGRPPRRPDAARIVDPKLSGPDAARIVDPKLSGPDAAPPRSPSDDLPAATEKPKRRKR